MSQQYHNNKKHKRVALVHDFLLYPGGAEKVLGELMVMFPHAPVFTLLYDKGAMAPMHNILDGRRIHVSFLQKLPRWCRRHLKWLLLLMPTAVETFDLREYDLVISSSGAWSKGIVTRVTTDHVAYLHSPMRFAWDENSTYTNQRAAKRLRFFVRWALSYLRVWDFEAAQRPDALVANSLYTQQRITKFYRRDAVIAYPPVSFSSKSSPTTKSDNQEKPFLIVSRLSEYKHVRLAVEVCTRLELSLVVVGTGREQEDLKRCAGETVQILGWQNEQQLETHYHNARALLFGAEEDFGLVMAEALAHHVPVIAYGRGGACEIVEPGVTGELFYAQTHEVMADGIRRFLERESAGGYDTSAMKQRVAQFTRAQFRAGIIAAIGQCKK